MGQDTPQVQRILPGSPAPTGDWESLFVAVLSHWRNDRESLPDRIDEVFAAARSVDGLPSVLVVDDTRSDNEDHRIFLDKLTDAGACVLVPESDEEREAVRNDPFAYAADQFRQAVQVATALPPPPVSQPDGYEAFGTAFTKLSPEELESLIEGRRTDDWKYEP
jgi:hypothetical protein